MEDYIKYSFIIEIGLISVVMALLYFAVHLSQRRPPSQQQPPSEVIEKLDELTPKLNELLAAISAPYESTLHSPDHDLKYDRKITRDIGKEDDDSAALLPKRLFNTQELLDTSGESPLHSINQEETSRTNKQ